MRLEKLTVKGLGPFREATSVDLESLDAKLVAVCGGNGAGKSTLLELFPAALYRQAPTRGTLAELALGRASYVEAVIVNEGRYTIRHLIDAETGKGESFVRDGSGAQVLADGKVRSFDAWAKRTLPSPEVLYASTFAAQGSAGFLELKPAERKGVLLRVLGIDRLEQLSQSARDRAREAKASAQTIAARIADVRKRADVASAERAHADALTSIKEDDAALVQARTDLATAKANEETRAKRAALEAAQTTTASHLSDLDGRIANNRRVLAERSSIEAAVARTADLQTQAGRIAADRSRIEAEQRAAQQALDARKQSASTLETRLQAAKSRKRAADTRRADAPKIAEATHALPALRVRIDAANASHESARLLEGTRRNVSLVSAEGRVASLREGLVAIRDVTTDDVPAAQYAAYAIAHDDIVVAEAAEAPRLLALALEARKTAWQTLERSRSELARAEALAARAGEMAAAARDGAAADEESRQLETALAHERQALTTAEKALRAELAIRLPDVATIDAELARLRPLAAKAAPLAQAEARLAELEPQAVTALAELERLRSELEALPIPVDTRVDEQERRFAAAETRVRRAHANVAVAASAVEAAREAAAEMASLDEELATVDDFVADWSRLGSDLGRDGLQALEIDAAAPELGTLANDLLTTCVGSRWAVSIETTKLSADGKKLLEGLEVRVLDSERGRDAAADSLSGGERVLVSEAIALALSMLAMRRAGIEGSTIVRDESGAALDPANGRAYIAMLRRAADIVGARHVLFVSHSAELAELADARIVVRDGTLAVESSS